MNGQFIGSQNFAGSPNPAVVQFQVPAADLKPGHNVIEADYTQDYYYADSSATVSVAIVAAPQINWGNLASIKYGTPLSSQQLDATATFGGTTVAGTFVYTPTFGTILAPGLQTLQAVFTPTDTQDYESITTTTTLNVAPPPTPITSGAIVRVGRTTTYTQQISIDTTPGAHQFIVSNLPSQAVLQSVAGATMSSGPNGTWIVSFTAPASGCISFVLTFNDPLGTSLTSYVQTLQ